MMPNTLAVYSKNKSGPRTDLSARPMPKHKTVNNDRQPPLETHWDLSVKKDRIQPRTTPPNPKRTATLTAKCRGRHSRRLRWSPIVPGGSPFTDIDWDKYGLHELLSCAIDYGLRFDLPIISINVATRPCRGSVTGTADWQQTHFRKFAHLWCVPRVDLCSRLHVVGLRATKCTINPKDQQAVTDRCEMH